MYIKSMKSFQSSCSKIVLKGSAASSLILIWEENLKFLLKELQTRESKVENITGRPRNKTGPNFYSNWRLKLCDLLTDADGKWIACLRLRTECKCAHHTF